MVPRLFPRLEFDSIAQYLTPMDIDGFVSFEGVSESLPRAAETGLGVGTGVGEYDGFEVGDRDGEIVRVAVDGRVGLVVGGLVGFEVGEVDVGVDVGVAVGTDVGSEVGGIVGTNVGATDVEG